MIASAFWRRSGRTLGPVAVARRANGLLFRTVGDAPTPEPLSRPGAATGFRAVSDADTAAITAATWTRVGRLLAAVPLESRQTSIAITAGLA